MSQVKFILKSGLNGFNICVFTYIRKNVDIERQIRFRQLLTGVYKLTNISLNM